MSAPMSSSRDPADRRALFGVLAEVGADVADRKRGAADHRHDAWESHGCGSSRRCQQRSAGSCCAPRTARRRRCRQRCRSARTERLLRRAARAPRRGRAGSVHSRSPYRVRRVAATARIALQVGVLGQVGSADGLHVALEDGVPVACDDDAGAVVARVGVAGCDALHPAADTFACRPRRPGSRAPATPSPTAWTR